MDGSVTGLITVVCQHSFHCNCLLKWGDSRCASSTLNMTASFYAYILLAIQVPRLPFDQLPHPQRDGLLPDDLDLHHLRVDIQFVDLSHLWQRWVVLLI